jgi:hypothetical protein
MGALNVNNNLGIIIINGAVRVIGQIVIVITVIITCSPGG